MPLRVQDRISICLGIFQQGALSRRDAEALVSLGEAQALQACPCHCALQERTLVILC